MSEHGNETQPGASDERFADHRSFRASLVQLLRRQIFGPSVGDGDTDLGELLTVSPLQLYATGVLFPQRLIQNLLEGGAEPASGDETVQLDDNLAEPEVKEVTKGFGNMSDAGTGSDEREPLNLANEFSPSACGISFRLEGPASLVARVSYGTYSASKKTEPHPRAGQTGVDGTVFPETREVPAYLRKHYDFRVPIAIGEKIGALDSIEINKEDKNLKLHVTIRERAKRSLVVSAMIVNHLTANRDGICTNEDAYFQVAVEVSESSGGSVFLPIDRDEGSASNDQETIALELLYRHRRAFALGHGVAGDWNRSEDLSMKGRTDWVASAALPTYELKPILPRQQGAGKADLQLSMSFLCDAAGQQEPEALIIQALTTLAEDYQYWIDETSRGSETLEQRLGKAARINLANCRKCLERILTGIEVLRSDRRAMLAFRLMNRAMLIQQYHSSVLRFREAGSPFPDIPPGYRNLPEERKWYPFQLAFILMNIAGMSSHEAPERALVDLIWFPTGGGKTEAYLGLAAFTICMERLMGSAPGVTVLMRYTLRLLTAQQFQRAAALVLALEMLRRENELGANLGSAEISIGLWVGQSLSPNKRSDARAALAKLRGERNAPNPFQVLRCPWCGVSFTGKTKGASGIAPDAGTAERSERTSHVSGHRHRSRKDAATSSDNSDVLGYQLLPLPNSSERTVRFVCPDPACPFGSERTPLPILVIDEDIYDSPPTILIGTVDKFAQLAWDRRVGRLFGLGLNAQPPALVIQDELHLISGPLGSIVGLYETVIDRLCSRDGRTHKIVASTATIRRAKEQCKDLYARDTFEFPPQAVRAGESYFAFEDRQAPGRLYIGFLGTAVKSHQTALVRACSPLLQGVCEPTTEDEAAKRAIIDPYGTMVWYFNTLRELGHAATLCTGDIPEFLKGLRYRLNIPYQNSRYLREIVELTSRLGAEEIPGILQQLEIPWQMKPSGQMPVDILLATNMIAVGVDVPRLGLLVISGQPKGTSEYIQASSRVGRRYPGLVVTVYAQTKSRDRSHYERFVAYHQSLYRHVEPTSVTPFSPQARDRGMRGVLIALARQIADVTTPDEVKRHGEQMREQIDTIVERVRALDNSETEEAQEELEAWLNFWRRYLPPDYGRMAGRVDVQTLAYPFGSVPDPVFQAAAWPVMTSMRNVDGTCEAQVLNVYEIANAEAEER
jgi:Helicase conserved C-terminal domain